MHVVLTGATGALGHEILSQLLQTVPTIRITVVGRTYPALRSPRIRFLKMDMREFSSHQSYLINQLKSATHIIHAAADVSWNQKYPEACATNSEPSLHLAQIGQSCPHLQQFLYISTAAVDNVAGSNLSLRFTSPDEGFNNTYEASKAAAEQALQSLRIPLTIIRPSLIVGRESDGYIHRHNGIYQLFAAYLAGRLPFIVGDPQGVIDCIGVDTVAHSVLWAMDHRAACLGRIIYATAGRQHFSIAKTTALTSGTVNILRRRQGLEPLPEISIIKPDSFFRLYAPMAESSSALRPEFKRFCGVMKYFTPYLSMTVPRRFYPGEIVFSPDNIENLLSLCLQQWLKKHGSQDELRNGKSYA